MIVDFDTNGGPIGIELLGPQDLADVLKSAIPAERDEILRQLTAKRTILEEILSSEPG